MGAREIVVRYTKGRMSARPEYTSGRGANLSDLNSDLLESIYTGIKTEIDDEAARNFVQMVSEIPVLSATDFLISLYNLEGRGWKWRSTLTSDAQGIAIQKDSDGGYSGEVSRIHGMISTFEFIRVAQSGRDDTPSIRIPFLRKHREEYVFRGTDPAEPSGPDCIFG